MFYLYDDARARQFEPFAMTRPMGELRVGARLIRERWEHALGLPCGGFVSGDTLADFSEPGAPGAASGAIPAGAFLVNSRCAPKLATVGTADIWFCEGQIAAVRLTHAVPVEAIADGNAALEQFVAGGERGDNLEGLWLEDAWDLVADLEARLRDDLERLTAGQRPVVPPDCRVLGGHGVYAAPDATVEPFVTFDCSNGPVLIEDGATIQSFTRIQGPTWIGPHSLVGGDKITVCAIGPHCKIHGEAANSIFLGYSNKSHDGFLGHSYVGRWVNLGANTVTSNLKNTYGLVAVWTPSGMRQTDLQFLGTLFGDHAKTGIGLTLTTGCVFGAGAQVYGAEMPPKVVPPFAWGETVPYEMFEFDKFMEVAERVMARRHVELDERGRSYLRRVYESRWTVDA